MRELLGWIFTDLPALVWKVHIHIEVPKSSCSHKRIGTWATLMHASLNLPKKRSFNSQKRENKTSVFTILRWTHCHGLVRFKTHTRTLGAWHCKTLSSWRWVWQLCGWLGSQVWWRTWGYRERRRRRIGCWAFWWIPWMWATETKKPILVFERSGSSSCDCFSLSHSLTRTLSLSLSVGGPMSLVQPCPGIGIPVFELNAMLEEVLVFKTSQG